MPINGIDAGNLTPTRGITTCSDTPCGRQVPRLCLCVVLCAALFVLSLCAGPFAPAAHADGGAPNLAYVAGTPAGISTIDIQQQKITGTIAINGDPHTIMLSLDGRYLYVAQPSLGQMTMLSAKTGQTICTAKVPGHPTLLVFDSTNHQLFAAANDASSITEIGDMNCNILHTYTVASPVYGLAIANVGSGAGLGNQLWVSDATSLVVFDTSKYNQVASTVIPGGPQYLSIPPGTEVYVTTRQGALDAVDLNDSHLVMLLSGGTFGPMDFDEVTDEVFVPDQLHKQIDVLTPVSSGNLSLPRREPGHVYPMGVTPESVAITSDGQLGFVALSSGQVVMIDIPGEQIANTFHVGGTPHFIITGLYPPLVGTTPQQSSIWDTVTLVLAYVFVAAVIIVPIYFFSRYTRKKNRQKKGFK